MKKLYFLLLLLIGGTFTAFAQSDDTKKADKHYNRFEYIKAAEEYEKLVEKEKANDYVYTQLANSYYFINDTKSAEKYYAEVADKEGTPAEIVYRYAESLKANGNFEKSNTWMRKFANMAPNDSRAVDFKNNPNYIPRILEKEQKFSATLIEGLNSSFSDFGGTQVGNKIYFASARNTSNKTYKRTQEPFLDIYEAIITDGKASDIMPVKGDVNTRYHEGTTAITADGKRMYFDRNDFYEGKYGKDSEGINQLNMYYAENVNGAWKDIKPVPFNNNEYSVGHPALSPDGTTLYFVSDMPGSIGESDIYKVSINADGTFGNPENLGKKINTEGKEVFPFIGNDGTLYFSSTGHLGLGGLDVFYAPKEGVGFGAVQNLGLPVNSTSDDFAYTIHDASQEGFVSSNRGGGEETTDNIYRIKQLEPLCESVILPLIVDANTNQPLSGVTVDIYDTKQNKLATKMAGSDGKVSFEVECDQQFVVQATIEGYESNSVTVSTDKRMLTPTIKLKPIEELITGDIINLNPIYFDFDKHNIKPQAALELDKVVQLMKINPEMKVKVEGHTDNRGSDTYNKQLSQRRAAAAAEYIVSKGIDRSRMSSEGFGEEQPAVACAPNCTEEQHQQNRRSVFRIVNPEVMVPANPNN